MNDNVDLSVRQFAGAWRLMASPSPHCSQATADGVECVFSGLPVAFFNIALIAERSVSADRLASHGRHACEWAADKGVPWLFVVTSEALEPGLDAVALLDGCGLAPMMTLTGMLAERVSPAARIPDGLQLVVPRDDHGCSAVVEINAAAYGMELEAGKAVVGTQSFWKDHVPVLGLADGKPASCAAVMMVDGHRYVALVATDPGHQRRGYADAAMRRALELSAQAHGEQPTVLHATDAGRPVYERMGYSPISTHTIFIEKTFLASA